MATSKIIQEAIRIAKTSTNRYGFKHGAVLTVGGKIFATASNNSDSHFGHAEINCVKQLSQTFGGSFEECERLYKARKAY